MTNAKDDVPHSPTRRTRFGVLVLGSALVGALAFVAAAFPLAPRFAAEIPWSGPAPGRTEWPRPPGPGESARVTRDGTVLRVGARDRASTRTLALAFAARHARTTDPLARARDRLRDRWRAETPVGPLPALAPAAECAAWLRAWAMVGHGLAGAETPSPIPAATPPTPDESTIAWVAAAQAADPAALETALNDALADDRNWLAALEAAHDRAASVAWRAHWRERIPELETQAEVLETSLTPLQRELVSATVAERAYALAARTPLPSPVTPLDVPVSPLVGPWLGLAAAGASLGAWVGFQLARRRRAPRFTPVAGAEDMRHAAGPSESWLHVISGPSVTSITRGALELCGGLIARGHRVLLIEGGRELALHVAVGGERRWGLMECLADRTPALGLVQGGGRGGLFVLAYGGRARAPRWTQLGRLLDEVHPHFGRIVLAIPQDAPRAVGDTFAGRVLDAWWSARVGLKGSAKRLDARLGIRFWPLELEPASEVVAEVAVAPAPGPEPIVEALPLPATPAPAPGVPAAQAPAAVLDCDLRVRERLRFLLWMRRVRREEPEPAGSAPAR